MGKLAPSSSKYVIYAHFDAEGTVEKPDVIGAVFGQTEGLLGQEMDLRELQRTGRIGRIDVDLKTENGKTSGTIIIPSSLDNSETALIAATVETIERIGPCNAKVSIEKVEDMRISKRGFVMERAKQLLGTMLSEGGIEVQEATEQLKDELRSAEVTEWNGMPAGPDIENQQEIIIVEGRADVINLLRSGVKNCVAIGGTSVPNELNQLTKGKTVTAFLDGDRGGDLILRELSAVINVDFVARAPEGKEVEELTRKDVHKSLRERKPLAELLETSKPRFEERESRTRTTKVRRPERRESRRYSLEPEENEKIKNILEDMTGTHAACFMTERFEIIGKVPLREVHNTLKNISASILVIDGEITQRIVNDAARNGIHIVIGMSSERLRLPENVKIFTLNDLED